MIMKSGYDMQDVKEVLLHFDTAKFCIIEFTGRVLKE